MVTFLPPFPLIENAARSLSVTFDFGKITEPMFNAAQSCKT
jgi:hypothetical protein